MLINLPHCTGTSQLLGVTRIFLKVVSQTGAQVLKFLQDYYIFDKPKDNLFQFSCLFIEEQRSVTLLFILSPSRAFITFHNNIIIIIKQQQMIG